MKKPLGYCNSPNEGQWERGPGAGNVEEWMNLPYLKKL